jgi:CRISPR-associated protein Csb2
MHSTLCISVRLLDPVSAFHGQREENESEWPPSPLRVFQALVAVLPSLSREDQSKSSAIQALKWLEAQRPPLIVAPRFYTGTTHRIAVPNNDLDVVANAWAKSLEPKKQQSELKTLKTVRAVRPVVNDDEPVRISYLWAHPGLGFEKHWTALYKLVRGVTHLGWGIDLAVANASVFSDTNLPELPGERWRPSDDWSALGLRVPMRGTLDALIAKHHAFLHRVGPEGFRPVPPLTAFDVVGYRRDFDSQVRPFAAFALLKLDGKRLRAFKTARRLKAVSGMVRYAAKHAAEQSGWPNDLIHQLILGHGERPGQPHKPVSGPRLAYVPLPTIQFRGYEKASVVTDIRRVIVMQMGRGKTGEFEKLMRQLGGAELVPDPVEQQDSSEQAIPCATEWEPPELPNPREPIALLSRLPQSDSNLRLYTRPSSTWATVTPLILPGYDDPRHFRRRLSTNCLGADERSRLLNKLDARIDDLIRAAIVHAGYAPGLARSVEIDWSGGGFWPGVELASHYEPPLKLRRFPRLHVRITWRGTEGKVIALPGPICLGGGRYFGFGLFAAMT